MSPAERDAFVAVRMSTEERAMLLALAAELGVSASDILRMLVRKSYRDQFGDKKPPKPKK